MKQHAVIFDFVTHGDSKTRDLKKRKTCISSATTSLFVPQFVTQPFVVGERISLKDVSGELVRGYVESIAPMFTSVRGDDLMLVSVPNKTVRAAVLVSVWLLIEYTYITNESHTQHAPTIEEKRPLLIHSLSLSLSFIHFTL